MALLSVTSLAPAVLCFPSGGTPRSAGAVPCGLPTSVLWRFHGPTRRRAAYSPSAATTITAIAAPQQAREEDNRVTEIYPKWRDFATRVSGEWDGYGADFTSKGEPIELPENVVPEAFREWGVQVFDWQTQCPTLAEAGEPSVTYKLIKLLPTVGCEADAATRHSVEERIVGGDDNKVLGFAYDQNGSYVALWAIKGYGEGKILEIEHCLVDPRNHEIRMRIIQNIQVEEMVLEVKRISVFSEQWYGPFRNGEQLGGCAIQESGFASGCSLRKFEVLGTWDGTCLSASFQNAQVGVIHELVKNRKKKLVREEEGLVTLPKQLWSSLRNNDNEETCAEVGWLIDEGRSVTSRCIFTKHGDLKEIEVGHEAAILGISSANDAQ